MYDFQHQQTQPLVINIMLYRRRDGDLYRELMSVPNKFRAERLRNLANLCCLMREMGGVAVDSDRLHSLAEQHYANTVKQTMEDDSDDMESSMPLKLTVNFYNYPELYRDLAAIPNGNLSSRVKSLASAGALLNDISRLARNTIREGQSTGPVQDQRQHTAVDSSAMAAEEGDDEAGREKADVAGEKSSPPKKNSAIGKIRM